MNVHFDEAVFGLNTFLARVRKLSQKKEPFIDKYDYLNPSLQRAMKFLGKGLAPSVALTDKERLLHKLIATFVFFPNSRQELTTDLINLGNGISSRNAEVISNSLNELSHGITSRCEQNLVGVKIKDRISLYDRVVQVLDREFFRNLILLFLAIFVSLVILTFSGQFVPIIPFP